MQLQGCAGEVGAEACCGGFCVGVGFGGAPLSLRADGGGEEGGGV